MSDHASTTDRATNDVDTSRGKRRVAAALAGTLAAGGLLSVVTGPADSATATSAPPNSTPASSSTAYGSGGAVTSVDANASRIGVEVLRGGGNAADAAVATASALGVSEPYSAGIGGGGYFVYHDARRHTVSTIDGRETAPAGITHGAFLDPATGKPYRFTPELVSSGVAVGVPGTLATWESALDRFGTRSLARSLAPSIALARKGFVVDSTFRNQTLDNAARFAAFPATARLFLPGGDAPKIGTRFRNPELARTLTTIARHGPDAFYRGPLAGEIARTVQNPPKDPSSTLPAPSGSMTSADLARYRVVKQAPSSVSYRGLEVYGMAPSSSGGTSVGEALNILENYRLGGGSKLARSLHLYIEASARAFADRGAFVGDPAYVPVPTRTLLSQRFADSRACTIDTTKASTRPVAAGSLDGRGCATTRTIEKPDTENVSTTHLSVVDRWGNAASYTLTIEQTGGSAMTVPGRGFLLNNELTDFTAVHDPQDPNRLEPGKRPRSSMSPTIVLKGGRVMLVAGSPGGATIITTVLQVLVNRIDLGMTLPEAVAAPRASQRNAATTSAEPEFIAAYGDLLKPYGQLLVPSGDTFTSAAEIGAAATIEVGRDGSLTAVAEPKRRGGGSAQVVNPRH
ncbi:gamma-glutamyltransferase [Aeromicrobium sp.]|uniref:gamma-glutamyltransferase n=1 Tax=Aeromicrobium sp. TaxID=1871063 RepID=UPI0019B8905C|nr:gamma-glutamyltransferase [Aeromicrobium sp.]MBC7633487.1 gamma-glutamyltransferase [Aeromicrobium sp.]